MDANTAWTTGVLALLVLAWTVWLTRSVVLGGARDNRGRELEGVRPGAAEREPDTVTAYHYRTSSRFGEYVQLRFHGGVLQVSGRRLGVGGYCFFIGLQVLLMALVPVALAAAVLAADWCWVLAAVALFAAFAFASSAMAGGFWEGPGIAACQEPATLSRVEFPLESVSDISIGTGWARNRLAIVIWPFVKSIDALAAGHAVSFEAPDPVSGRRVVYAMHFYTAEEAAEFVERLWSE
ncbi:MAG: hypothetical protein IBX63_03630 [Coriobacteriia bacterium]|nr:hypothetical protein [Coriobacteriia bacterium]